MGYIGAASYMHTADRDSIVNLTARDYSAYIICGRLDGRFVVYEQSVKETYEHQVPLERMRWHDTVSKGGWIATLVVAVGSMLLISSLSPH
jgi:hypothetical protein